MKSYLGMEPTNSHTHSSTIKVIAIKRELIATYTCICMYMYVYLENLHYAGEHNIVQYCLFT